MKADYLIRQGQVLDKTQELDGIADIAVADGRIAAVGTNLDAEGAAEVDASGCLVTAGLIDGHMHLFEGCGLGGVRPDAILFPMGVTAAFDAGSAGVGNYKLFSKEIARPSWPVIKAFLNVSPLGLATASFFPENLDPRYFDVGRIKTCLKEYPKEIIALKVRITKHLVGEFGLEPLRAASEIAKEVGLPLVVHTTDPAGTVAEVLAVLCPGDVYCHAFHGVGHTILDEDGQVLPCVKEAKARGILFDVANGMAHFSFSVAQAAVEQGFYPDMISTDLTRGSLYKPPVYSLPYTMSKYLALGMPLAEVFAAATYKVARAFRLEKEMGNLRPGTAADLAVFRLKKQTAVFSDAAGNKMSGDSLLVPQLTMKSGVVVYRQTGFI
jgi:dihydroorotase